MYRITEPGVYLLFGIFYQDIYAIIHNGRKSLQWNAAAVVCTGHLLCNKTMETIFLH